MSICHFTYSYHADEQFHVQKVKPIQIKEPKNRKISFWQLPTTPMKYEFQIESKQSKTMKSVTTQTTYTK